jgi:NADPH-dependent ferric siderophore reductase
VVNGKSATPPIDDPRNVFIQKRKDGYESSDAGDEYGLITASSMLAGIFEVKRTELVTPRMRRITIGGPELEDVRNSWQPGWDLRALFPPLGQTFGAPGTLVVPPGVKPAVRTYTVRSFDDERLEFSMDIVIHENHGGLGSAWAQRAQEGDLLAAALRYPEASPRDHDADWYLLVGDETAIPVIGSIIETFPAEARATVFIEAVDEDDLQTFETDADVTVNWLYRRELPSGTTDLLVRAVEELEWPEGRAFAWVTGEVRMASALRRFVREVRGLTRADYKVQAYWRRGMTEPERLDRVKQNIAPLIAQGVDPIELYNERGMAGDDPTLDLPS